MQEKFGVIAALTGVARTAIVAAAAAMLAGCVSNGNGGGSPMAAFAQAGAITVAFESIDGPPPQVFDRMVSLLDSETKLRAIPVVSREGSAAYRVRSYLAAQIRGGRTIIAWVWDVYDSSQQRALRLSGEEPVGKSGRDAWSQADDVVLRRIAQAGLSGLMPLLGGAAPEPALRPTGAGPAIAAAETTRLSYAAADSPAR